MIETPLGVLRAESIASSSKRNACLVMGTQDLAKDLRLVPGRGRLGLLSALSNCVLIARALGLDILDGVYPNFRDAPGFQASCTQGRGLGFDGKTLIHPDQIGVANEAFGPREAEIGRARALVGAWNTQRGEGQAIVVVEGQMVEQLHVEEARDLLTMAEAIARQNE